MRIVSVRSRAENRASSKLQGLLARLEEWEEPLKTKWSDPHQQTRRTHSPKTCHEGDRPLTVDPLSSRCSNERMSGALRRLRRLAEYRSRRLRSPRSEET